MAVNNRAGFACPNPICLCTVCTCGVGCTCGVSIEVNCDPCKAFKKALIDESLTTAAAATYPKLSLLYFPFPGRAVCCWIIQKSCVFYTILHYISINFVFSLSKCVHYPGIYLNVVQGPIRNALKLCKIPFEDKHISFPDLGKIKGSGSLPFDSLPVLTIGDSTQVLIFCLTPTLHCDIFHKFLSWCLHHKYDIFHKYLFCCLHPVQIFP